MINTTSLPSLSQPPVAENLPDNLPSHAAPKRDHSSLEAQSLDTAGDAKRPRVSAMMSSAPEPALLYSVSHHNRTY